MTKDTEFHIAAEHLARLLTTRATLDGDIPLALHWAAQAGKARLELGLLGE